MLLFRGACVFRRETGHALSVRVAVVWPANLTVQVHGMPCTYLALIALLRIIF